MSVICFDEKEIANLCNTVLYSRAYTEAVKSLDDKYTWKNISRMSKQSETDYYQVIIKCWFQRLYISNQLAFEIMYNREEEMQINKLSEEAIDNGSVITDKKRLYDELSSLEYNLYDNAGRTFTSHEDMERLRRLLNRVVKDIAKIGIIHY